MRKTNLIVLAAAPRSRGNDAFFRDVVVRPNEAYLHAPSHTLAS